MSGGVITITAAMPAVQLAPATLREEVVQNVATILATWRGSVPFDRTLGIHPDWLDDPSPVAQARATADIIQSIRLREPRARVESVEWPMDTTAAMDGVLRPVVRIAIIERGA